MLETRQPRTLKLCALLDKPERREENIPIHYRGFTIANKFVFGYGLDLDEYYRNLPFVAVVDLDKKKNRGGESRVNLSSFTKGWWERAPTENDGGDLAHTSTPPIPPKNCPWS